MGVSVALLTYGLARQTPASIISLVSAPALLATALGQWAPLLTAAVLFPWLAPVWVAKPTVGFALLVAYPSVRAVAGGAALLVGTLVLRPSWPVEWWENAMHLSAAHPHPVPLLLPGGVLALLALLRWRRPEARLVAAMACVPQILLFADQLPLVVLVPRTFRERAGVATATLVGLAVARRLHGTNENLAFAGITQAAVLCTTYLPCLLLVLRRPNDGDLPAWLSRRRVDAPER
jgi:hypothetical protein